MKAIPYGMLPTRQLLTLGKPLRLPATALARALPDFSSHIRKAGIDSSPEEYVMACLASDVLILLILAPILGLPLGMTKGFIGAAALVLLVLVQQLAYPRIRITRRAASIDANLLPALRDLLVQINAGVSLYDAFQHLAIGEYGHVSDVMAGAVARIRSGEEQQKVIEDVGTASPSQHLRRVMHQLSNGLRGGSDLAPLLQELSEELADEQLIQLQSYGSQLNPLAMLYMLFGVIAPALSLTAVVILSSIVRLEELVVNILFGAVFFGFLIFQLAFIILIRSRRPVFL